jgi:sigma-B regulation protein RsbU (phosphoserine phosphatase)
MVFDEERVTLERGDVVIAFSDGVTEALDPAGEEFTDERLIAAATAHRGKPPQEMLAALIDVLHTFCGDATQTDDVTLVAMEYTGAAAT